MGHQHEDPEEGRSPSGGGDRREAILASIPARYSPQVHFVVPALLGLAVLGFCVWGARNVQPVEWLTVPATLFSGFAFEWRVHKSVLHRRLPLLGTLYERHELKHHVLYTFDRMEMRSPSETWLILMPTYAIVLVFGMMVPLVAAVWWFATLNVALIMLATSMLFFLAYEWFHLAYHLPLDHPIARIGLIRRLREVHRRHHDPRLMKRWNFNVTFPLFDWIHGTLWSRARESRRDASRARRPVAQR